MKQPIVIRRTAMAIAVSTVFLLSACAGGGGSGGPPPGGGGGGIPGSGPSIPTPSYSRSEVPYSTPVRQAVIDPLVNTTDNGYKWAVSDTFAANVSDTSSQDLLIAGRMTQPTASADWGNFRLSLFSWQNGQLVDKTAQWFPNDTNIIVGTEPSVKFADFFKTGRNDLFVAPGTDSTIYGPTYFYRNTGTSFERQTLTNTNIWAHDSAVGDLDGDGYKDIAMVGYGANSLTVALNNRVSSFNVYSTNNGGGSIAVADFMQNGRGQMIITDQERSGNTSATNLYSWAINGSNALELTKINTLPTPRFELPKWSSYNFGGNHTVRSVAYDFNNDHVPDAILFSRPANWQQYPNWSEIQFLKNNGGGNFSDVTDTTLVGYNNNTAVTYNPKFLDLNGDGLEDILVSGTDFSGNNKSTQFLLKSNDGKYVAAYQNVLADFVAQANSMQGADNAGNTVNVIKGPGGKLYLVTAVSFSNGGDRQLALYMSDLGSQNTTTAQSAINLILQKWPYMTVPQANEVLAKTTATYFNGVGIINDEDIFKPVGTLSLSTIGGLKPISGYLAGVDLGDGSVMATDLLGRGYNLNLSSMNVRPINAFGYNTEHVDQHNLTSHAEYLVNGTPMTVGNMRVATENRNALFGNDQGPSMLNKPTQYTVGIPEVYRSGKWSYGMQYTNLNSNPWIAFGGSWGSVTNSGILDNVVTYRHNGFSTQASLMNVTTNITPGLITKVNNITGAWGEAGYRFGDVKREGDVGFYAGIKPVVLSGSVETRLPTSIDNQGNIQYTNKTLAIQNQVTPYVRALYTNMLDRQTQYRVSAMAAATNGASQYRIMHEIKYFLD